MSIPNVDKFKSIIKRMNEDELVTERRQIIDLLHTSPLTPESGATAERIVELIEIELEIRKPVIPDIELMTEIGRAHV